MTRYAIIALCVASTLFLIGAAWFTLVEDWRLAVWCVGASVVSFGVAFVWSTLTGLEPD